VQGAVLVDGHGVGVVFKVVVSGAEAFEVVQRGRPLGPRRDVVAFLDGAGAAGGGADAAGADPD